MNATELGYSLKNIPITSKYKYLKLLTEKVESFVRRVRWKAHFFECTSDKENNDDDSNFGFKSIATPPQHELLIDFENDLYEMIRNVTFKNDTNDFLQSLENDVKKIRTSENMLISADKTTNLYEMPTEQYKKLLHDNITKSYQKTNPSTVNEIDIETKTFAKKLELDKKMERFANRQAFITLKDHKDNFKTKLQCRLINPAKSEIGIVAKHYLEIINSQVINESHVNQWRNTATVIDWFKNINKSIESRFIKFDIVDFYPSISETLLNSAIRYASNISPIPIEQINIIKQARKSILFNNDDVWVKKGDNPMFDVTMGCYDGAEICELVGLYMLSKLSTLIEKTDIGLYRDDGLCVVYNPNGPKLDRLRKKIIKLFKDEDLCITIDTNLTNTDFLDVTLDLNTGKYYPYRKQNDNPLYVNANSNHPPCIIKELPAMINKRICDLSINQTEFDKAKTTYESALKSSGFNANLTYTEKAETDQRRPRTRKIIWFNPPYSKQVKSDIGRTFLKLVRKHFPRQHHLHKIFNVNTIKLSYSCTPNMASIIKSHNTKLLNISSSDKETKLCNCRDKNSCPLSGKCLSSCIVYKAMVVTDQAKSTYYGICESDFKTRYNNHTKSFRSRKYENETELSKLVWKLKDDNANYAIHWSIEKNAGRYKCGTRRCDLCLSEKVAIVRANPKGLLNKRTELVSKCRHKNKFVIGNVK